tara:strand:+ start:355 stop:525 length:171 start_codon:yes stop_codon:yes gene_type:complete
MKSFKDEERDAEYLLDKMVEYELRTEICECGFPINPNNDVYDAGSECICDLKEEEE